MDSAVALAEFQPELLNPLVLEFVNASRARAAASTVLKTEAVIDSGDAINDIFISHNKEDRVAAQRLAEEARQKGLVGMVGHRCYAG